MQLGKGWQFKFTSPTAGNTAKLGSNFGTGIKHRQAGQVIFHLQPMEFGSHDIDVKTYILSHYEF